METNKFHALQLFTDTFTAETVHLSNEQVGIYIRLLCFAWTKNTKPFSTKSGLLFLIRDPFFNDSGVVR